MVKLEYYNGAHWVLDKMITFSQYRTIIKLSPQGEGKTWRVTI